MERVLLPMEPVEPRIASFFTVFIFAFSQIGVVERWENSGARGTNDVVGDRTEGRTDEGQQDRREDIIPASTSHFTIAEENVFEQKF